MGGDRAGQIPDEQRGDILKKNGLFIFQLFQKTHHPSSDIESGSDTCHKWISIF